MDMCLVVGHSTHTILEFISKSTLFFGHFEGWFAEVILALKLLCHFISVCVVN
jgi:hypothetical protein